MCPTIVDLNPAGTTTAQRNPGFPLSLDTVKAQRVNHSAVMRRITKLTQNRSVKKHQQTLWLLRALQCIDLTTLAGDDTPGKVRRLCAKAKHPLRDEIWQALALDSPAPQVAAVCVYPNYVATAKTVLADSGIQIASVATGFPAGLVPLAVKLEEIRAAVAAGATEIDIVITRSHVLLGQWQALYDEVAAFREACGEAHMKTILATGELATLSNIAKASMVCMLAGADFIKTSTGKETQNATLPVGLTMLRQIRQFYFDTGIAVGFKPAGGVKTAKQALQWLALVKEECGDAWLTPHLFRFGASSLLTDIERQLEHRATGRYAATYRQPMA